MTALTPEMLEHVAERFRVLADTSRLRIIQTLRTNGELNVGELVERLDMSQANISKHLRLLHDSGVVARRPQGTAAYYSVADPSIERLCDLVCNRLRDQIRDEAEAFSMS